MNAKELRRLMERTVFFAVADLTEPVAEPYAVLRIDTDKRIGSGVQARIESLHWSRDVAQQISDDLNEYAARGMIGHA